MKKDHLLIIFCKTSSNFQEYLVLYHGLPLDGNPLPLRFVTPVARRQVLEHVGHCYM